MLSLPPTFKQSYRQHSSSHSLLEWKEQHRQTETDTEKVALCGCGVCMQTGGRALLPQANNLELEILAGVMIEHGSLITGLPGWLALTMTYHRAEEHGVYNKILQHDKHCPEEIHTTL